MDQGLKHVLSVSYNKALLRTRELLLRRRGYNVTSCFGFANAIAACKATKFDLFILGHSIPSSDKLELIKTFRRYCPAPVLSLLRKGESVEAEADSYVSPESPEVLLDRVDELLRSRIDTARRADNASG